MEYTIYRLLLNDDQIFIIQHLCVFVTSRAIAGGPEAPNTLRDDSWLVAASHEAAALPQSLQGLLRPV